MTILITLHI